MQTWVKRVYQQKNVWFLKHLVACIADMAVGMSLSHSVQLPQLATWLPFAAQNSSTVRRFERLLADERLNAYKYWVPFVRAMQTTLGPQQIVLVIDSTKVGRCCRSIFVGILYHGTILPIGFKTIKGAKGHATAEVHLALLKLIYPQWCNYRDVVLLGDSEFCSKPVLDWLKDKGWHGVFHLSNQHHVRLGRAEPWQQPEEVIKAAKITKGQVTYWRDVSYTQKHNLPGLTMIAHWDASYQKPLHLLSTLPPEAQPEQLYEQRYWIEPSFRNLKSSGFNLNQTHLTEPAQIDRLLLCVAVATAFILGVATDILLTRQTKLVDRSDRRDLSLFQIGRRALLRFINSAVLSQVRIIWDWGLELPPAGFIGT